MLMSCGRSTGSRGDPAAIRLTKNKILLRGACRRHHVRVLWAGPKECHLSSRNSQSRSYWWRGGGRRPPLWAAGLGGGVSGASRRRCNRRLPARGGFRRVAPPTVVDGRVCVLVRAWTRRRRGQAAVPGDCGLQRCFPGLVPRADRGGLLSAPPEYTFRAAGACAPQAPRIPPQNEIQKIVRALSNITVWWRCLFRRGGSWIVTSVMSGPSC